MAVISREELAQIAYQAGFRGEALVDIVAIAGRESGYRTDAHRTDRPKSDLSGDRGLLQINYVHDQTLRNAGIISSPADLFDPLTNLRAAKFLYDRDGLSPWTAAAGGWTAGGDPFYGTDRDAAAAAVARANLGTPYRAPEGSSVPSTGNLTLTLPSDAHVWDVEGQRYALFNVDGVVVAFELDVPITNTNLPSAAATRDQFNGINRTHHGLVMGGSASELVGVADDFGSFKALFDRIMDEVFVPGNPARKDPSVLRVMAEYAARPDMSEAELDNKLQATAYYNSRTQKQLAWNDLPEAERELQTREAAASAANIIRQYTGLHVSVDDPRVRNYADKLASGEMGWNEYGQIVKEQALADPESLFFRQQRDETEARRQRGIDVENTAQNIRETLNRWGLSWTNNEVTRWAREMAEKKKSDEDLMKAIKSAASALYPWKDPEQETVQAAQPWLQTYERVMERRGSLETAEIQRALTAGQPAWEFEKELKRTDGWLTTKNAEGELTSLVSEMGRRMGYV